MFCLIIPVNSLIKVLIIRFEFRYLMEGAELIDTTSNAMDRLLQYLDSNLTTLHDNLNEDNFERVLLVIWEIMSETLYELVFSNLKVLGQRLVHMNLTSKILSPSYRVIVTGAN